MSMLTLIALARASAEAHLKDRDTTALESFSETHSTGIVVTCIPVLASNAFETTVGHVRITWQMDGNRCSTNVIERLYRDSATPEELAELKAYKEKQAWMKKFGITI